MRKSGTWSVSLSTTFVSRPSEFATIFTTPFALIFVEALLAKLSCPISHALISVNSWASLHMCDVQPLSRHHSSLRVAVNACVDLLFSLRFATVAPSASFGKLRILSSSGPARCDLHSPSSAIARETSPSVIFASLRRASCASSVSSGFVASVVKNPISSAVLANCLSRYQQSAALCPIFPQLWHLSLDFSLSSFFDVAFFLFFQFLFA